MKESRALNRMGLPEDCRDKSSPFGDVIDRIRALSEGTERDFLAIGRGLQAVREKSAVITKDALAASTIMGGDEIKGVIEGLKGMIHQLEMLLGKSEGLSNRNLGSLRSIGRVLREVRDGFEGLRETARDLRMLALSTKIQSSRTGLNFPAFMQLGQDITEMATMIDSNSTRLSDHAADLTREADKAGESLRDLKRQQQEQTGKVLQGANRIIEALNALSERSGEEVRRVKNSSDVIASSIDKLVVSVQYQDITRQAFDAVVRELEGWKEYEGIGACDPPGSLRGGTAGSGDLMTVSLCLRESRRIASAGENAGRAVAEIADSLQAVADSIEAMAAVAERATSGSAHFLTELDKGMASVTSFLTGVVESGREMSAAMNHIAATVDDMSHYTDDIEMISSEVELISLNARILAGQRGSGGAGMSVIAQAVQNTANESEAQRQILRNLLVRVSESALELREELERTTGSEEVRLDELVRELGVLLDALRIMQRKILSTLQRIDGLSRNLVQRVSSTVQKIVTQQRIREEVARISQQMETGARMLCGRLTAEEMYRLLDGAHPMEELCRSGGRERLDLIKEHLPEVLRPEPDPEDGQADMGDILF